VDARAVTGVTPDRSGDLVSEHAPPGRGPLVLAGLALAVAIVLPLLVWTYARTEPELAGIPFFFWYQFLLVLVSVVLTSVAYRLVIGHERRRRRAEGRRDVA
jgi:phosphoglycerol transferase MdoB-like AlkP superfamily enzyme